MLEFPKKKKEVIMGRCRVGCRAQRRLIFVIEDFDVFFKSFSDEHMPLVH